MKKDHEGQKQGFQCPITKSVLFEPVQVVHCRHQFERDSIERWIKEKQDKATCPCCRRPIEKIEPAEIAFEIALAAAWEDPKISKDVYFNLDKFAEVVHNNKLYTTRGQRFITLLSQNENHLNDVASAGQQQGKSAITFLASTPAGRQLLRKKLKTVKTDSGDVQFFFGNAKITSQSLRITVEGRPILEWLKLSNEIDMQLTQKEAEGNWNRRISSFFFRTKNNSYCDAANPILQAVVNGKKAEVRFMLENLKNNNPALLKTVLSATATQPMVDYSGRIFENITLLQAAACAGDSAIYSTHPGMCEIISDYFDQGVNGAAEKAKQLQSIFPNGIDTCVREQSQPENIFNFISIVTAINNATPDMLEQALNKTGASMSESGAARSKLNHQLTLVEALNRFREEFKACLFAEKIFNPRHLLEAMRLYDVQYQHWNANQRDLFACQVIGFIQSLLPANYAQIFAHGLHDMIASAHAVPDHFNFTVNQTMCNTFYSDKCEGLGFDYMILKQARTSLPKLSSIADVFSDLISRKNENLNAITHQSQQAASQKAQR